MKGGKVAILERQVNGREYNELLKRKDPTRITIKKNIKCFIWKNQYFELITFTQPEMESVILRTETEQSGFGVDLPPFVQVEKEVTKDEKFMSYYMARNAMQSE